MVFFFCEEYLKLEKSFMQILLCPGKGQLFPYLPEIGICDGAFELTLC